MCICSKIIGKCTPVDESKLFTGDKPFTPIDKKVFLASITQFSEFGTKGKEWISYKASTTKNGALDSYEVKLVKKDNCFVRLFNRIFGKKVETRLKVVSNFLTAYLETNKNTLSELQGEDSQKAKASLDKMKTYFTTKSPQLAAKIDEIAKTLQN